ncbi:MULTISPECIES: GNAT family N-acetyltransferase [Undibacterium]|jgi:putative hemolysin|uniref:L-ornithine N(alpha)-acyltransferase n=1 Tax=Undibacterium umbellatum TaxID=2762300 RepID=A0ABR6Z4L3_9BURK|nr:MULTISPECIES: GNAT family N-acyltransferase [Undibacterium]MBC3906720.1 GNAT family N-acetyltransferase [Undibacterium umbellatum]MDP1979721.1 GNAT family N-acyltransferase [Undibacterium sp.]
MRLLTIPADANPSFSKLNLSLATTAKEVKEVQRLRYKVFIESMGLSALSNPDGLDKDEFDEHCDHLIVRDSKTLKVVGTYRILGPNAARQLGRYYSETEFDLSRLQHIRNSVAEAGRACIHPDYRSGAVIMLLWAGLAAYMRRERCSHLIGCASISLTDGGQNAAAIYRGLSAGDFSPLEYRVTPHTPFPLDEIDSTSTEARIPPLLKGYLRAGAWVCGDPAWDPDFHSADLFVMLPLANLDDRYARHYGTGEQ